MEAMKFVTVLFCAFLIFFFISVPFILLVGGLFIKLFFGCCFPGTKDGVNAFWAYLARLFTIQGNIVIFTIFLLFSDCVLALATGKIGGNGLYLSYVYLCIHILPILIG